MEGKVEYCNNKKIAIICNGKKMEFLLNGFKLDNHIKKGANVIFELEGSNIKNIDLLNTKNKPISSLQNLQKSQNTSYFLPQDTANVIKNEQSTDNLSLFVNKYLCFTEFSPDDIKRLKRELNVSSNDIQKQPKKLNSVLEEISSDHSKIFSNYDAITLKTASRIVVGLGGASVYETGITLHHIYGVPYIPGSSIKGVVRSWIIQEYYAGDEEKAINDKDKAFRTAFGFQKETDAYRGEVTFLDAFPVKLNEVELDIMNPHFTKYYTAPQKSYPEDTDNPIPINFLALPKGIEFHFMLSPYKKLIKNKTVNEHLIEALGNMGIGAKTALGYGLFEPK